MNDTQEIEIQIAALREKLKTRKKGASQLEEIEGMKTILSELTDKERKVKEKQAQIDKLPNRLVFVLGLISAAGVLYYTVVLDHKIGFEVYAFVVALLSAGSDKLDKLIERFKK